MNKRASICQRYLNHTDQAWEEAKKKQPEVIRRYYQWLSYSLCVEFAGPSLVGKLTRALTHREVPPISSPSLTIHVWDTESTGVNMLPPEAPNRGFTGNEGQWIGEDSITDFRIGMCRHGEAACLLDRESHQGYFWTPSQSILPLWEVSGPFRMLLHWWLRPKGLQIIHAAAVGSEGKGILLVGKSGSGKSTTAFACLRAGMDLVGEDYCLVSTEKTVEAMSVYSTGKLTENSRSRFPALDKWVEEVPYYTSAESQKRLYFLEPKFQSRLEKQLTIKGILIPQVIGEGLSSLEACSKGEGIRALSPSTLLQLPLSGDEDLEQMSKIVKSLPVYRLKLGAQLEGAVAEISRFLTQ